MKLFDQKQYVHISAEIRDHETGLVSGPFSWFQSRQIFHETHETEANSKFSFITNFSFEDLLQVRVFA